MRWLPVDAIFTDLPYVVPSKLINPAPVTVAVTESLTVAVPTPEALYKFKITVASTPVLFVASADTATSAEHVDTSPAQTNEVVRLGSTVVEADESAAIVIVKSADVDETSVAPA